MSRRTRFTLVSLRMAVVSGLLLYLLPPNGKPGVTAANYQRLTPGMTPHEADTILGLGRNTDEHTRQWDGDGISVIATIERDQITTIIGVGDTATLTSTLRGWLGLLSPVPPVPPSAPVPVGIPVASDE